MQAPGGMGITRIAPSVKPSTPLLGRRKTTANGPLRIHSSKAIRLRLRWLPRTCCRLRLASVERWDCSTPPMRSLAKSQSGHTRMSMAMMRMTLGQINLVAKSRPWLRSILHLMKQDTFRSQLPEPDRWPLPRARVVRQLQRR